MSSDSEENNMEMPQFRSMWSPYAELTEDDLMDKDLQDTLTQLDRSNEQDLTENPNPTNQVQEDSHSENLENASVNPHFDAQYMDMTEHDIEQFIDGQQNKNTLTKTVRDIALLNKFLKAKNENRELQTIPPVELDPLLANYLLTLRKKDGGEYEPSTLRSIVSSIDRKLKRHKYGHSIAGSTTHQDEAFRLTRESLKAKQKVLKQKGKGNKLLRSQPITDDEINILYERNVLGDSCPDSLLRTIWLNNCVHFGLRGVQEHYTLRFVTYV
ncbi:unnamed protein product [Mytilus coruscus]|uniref:DUF3504 domain-containing protein n=1 Tax=Mytilus coruscus TaxID=42192 RepID=A0A6J8EXC7_MYTCO|nr:unnamed protein product [Mytilus coruscus]